MCDVRAFKGRGDRSRCSPHTMVHTARLLDEAGIPLILVGDSLGMVVLGHPTTCR